MAKPDEDIPIISSLSILCLVSSIYLLYTMLCQRCNHFLSSSLRSLHLRPFSTTSGLLRPGNPPPATSTSAAQPFSTPFTPSPSKTPGIPSSPSTTPKAGSKGPAHPPSSVAAGTPLRGLGYIKGQEGPVAKEDSEYPEWLWGLLEPKKRGTNDEALVGDAFGKLHLFITTTIRALHPPGVALRWLQRPCRQQPLQWPIVTWEL